MFRLSTTYALLIPGVLRLGHLRLPVFGLFAAAGLIAALLLGQRTARLTHLSEIALWDAGLFTVAAAFIASRLLLIARDPHAFRLYPLLVLALPSLTYGGMALTAVAVAIYLRRKRLPLLRVLDAWSPCAALLAAFLSLGHFVEGTDAGMPTRLPWGVMTPVLGRVHPVQLYSLFAALVLCALLLRSLARSHAPGKTAALGLLAAGALAYLLAMLTQPTQVLGGSWLEPGQMIALAAIAAGGVLRFRKLRPTGKAALVPDEPDRGY